MQICATWNHSKKKAEANRLISSELVTNAELLLFHTEQSL